MLYWGFSFEAYNGRLFNGERSLTTAGDLPKPILTAMELLERTGGTVLSAEGAPNGGPLGLLATADPAEGTLQLLAYHFDEQAPYDGGDKEVTVTVDGLDGSLVSFACYRIDKESTAYAAWVRQGCPATPAEADMDALMAAAEPVPTALCVPITEGRCELSLSLAASSMVLLCGRIG